MTRAQFRRCVKDANDKTDAALSEGSHGWNLPKKTFEGRDRKYSSVSSVGHENQAEGLGRKDGGIPGATH